MKDQLIFNLRREVDLLKLENSFLKHKVHELNGGVPIQFPAPEMRPVASKDMNVTQDSVFDHSNMIFADDEAGRMMQEFKSEIQRLRTENN